MYLMEKLRDRDNGQFRLAADFDPQGDQPQAIEKLVAGLAQPRRNQVLLGVTGSGKTFTMANVIARVNKPTLGDRAEQDLGGAVVQRISRAVSGQRGALFCQLLRLLSAGSLRAVDRHLH